MTALSILVVDDEINIRKTLSYCLKTEGHSVTAVGNPFDAVEEARRKSYDMAFVDLKLGEEDGLDLIPSLLSDSPWTKIIVITAFASVQTAVEAMRRGAFDYLSKPFSPDQIKFQAKRISRIRELETENASLKADLKMLDPEIQLQSRNPVMQRLLETARISAASEANILLQGGSGTGKSVLARAIHNWSPRSSRPLAFVACPSVPNELLESELFGHVKGAFTGALRDNPGRIASCEGGTLFLDEIGDIPPALQAKLLHFVQYREYNRIGEAVTRNADVRIVAATNVDIDERVASGGFREDLFYRLNVISLSLIRLKDRPEDILPMAEYFLKHFSRQNNKVFEGFTVEAEESLASHSWPGNLRELRNAVERAVILGTGNRIERKHLPDTIVPEEVRVSIGDNIPLSEIEELHIRRVLSGTSSIQEAADVLGIDKATLWRRRKIYGI